ncbi:MAG: hypothetical protein LBL66_04180 [Clostridiales bacterium]|jgi:hypothetical protein|nr:hypothetical protein [Clostridiales bacterium]
MRKHKSFKGIVVCLVAALLCAFFAAACGEKDPPVADTPDASVTPAAAVFARGGGDVRFTLTLSGGAAFEAVAKNGITADGYAYDAPEVTIKAAFLETLAQDGAYEFDIVTSAKALPVTVTVSGAEPPAPVNSTLTGSAFDVADLVPYDQPESGLGAIGGTRIASREYTVTAGDDLTAGKTFTLEIAGYASALVSGKLYYKVTLGAGLTVPPADLTGWTELADGGVAGATGQTAGGAFWLNVILVSSDPADMGKTASFTVGLTVG